LLQADFGAGVSPALALYCGSFSGLAPLTSPFGSAAAKRSAQNLSRQGLTSYLYHASLIERQPFTATPPSYACCAVAVRPPQAQQASEVSCACKPGASMTARFQPQLQESQTCGSRGGRREAGGERGEGGQSRQLPRRQRRPGRAQQGQQRAELPAAHQRLKKRAHTRSHGVSCKIWAGLWKGSMLF
jgi:hypothetical protein